MIKDEIAVYLNDHLEFFNDYPELLGKIKSIDNQDIPDRQSNTLSLSGRLIKRVNEDKEKLQSKLEWFVEVSRANEEIHQHLFEIDSKKYSVCIAFYVFSCGRNHCACIFKDFARLDVCTSLLHTKLPCFCNLGKYLASQRLLKIITKIIINISL